MFVTIVVIFVEMQDISLLNRVFLLQFKKNFKGSSFQARLKILIICSYHLLSVRILGSYHYTLMQGGTVRRSFVRHRVIYFSADNSASKIVVCHTVLSMMYLESNIPAA